MRIPLRYGVNPHQVPAEILLPESGAPIRILNGQPGYVNILDALNSWQLVKELRHATGLPAVSSFRQVSPSGTAVGYPLDERLKKAYQAEGLDHSLLACAYLRARSTDRYITEGDLIALSDPLDQFTAQLIGQSSAIGMIAPGFEPGTIELLKQQKGTDFLVIEMDPHYEPDVLEKRTIYGITLHQTRNHIPITDEILSRIATSDKSLPNEAKIDMLIALITLKYTRSNAICIVYKGQLIGIGAGQQTKSISAKLASEMAKNWMMRQHPRILTMNMPSYLNKVQKDQLINDFIDRKFNSSDVYSWTKAFRGITLASDGLINSRSILEEAKRIGVKYIIQSPDPEYHYEDLVKMCEDLYLTLVQTDVRFFHH